MSIDCRRSALSHHVLGDSRALVGTVATPSLRADDLSALECARAIEEVVGKIKRSE